MARLPEGGLHRRFLGLPERENWLCLLAVVWLALGLRVWGIGFGLPYDLTPDEPHHIFQAFRLGAGESGPLLSYWHTVGKGGMDYLLFVEYGLLYVFWTMMGWIADTREFALLYFQDPTVFYLTGRLTVALMGTLISFVVFLVGKRLYGFWVGLGAALIGACEYANVSHSHLINVHIGMTLAFWTSILSYLKYEDKTDRRWLIVTGILAGTAISFAYTAAIVVLALLLALASSSETRWNSRLVFGRAAVLLSSTFMTVMVLSPDLILNFSVLFKNFGQILGEGRVSSGLQEPDLRESIDSVTILRSHASMEYIRILLKPYNALITFSALVGAGIGLYQLDRWTIIYTVLVGIFLIVVSASNRGAGDRYLLPILPCLWITASLAIATLTRRRVWLTVVGALVVATPSLAISARQDYELTRPDTRIVAKQWIEANIPSGAKILMDGMRFRFVQSPPLNPNRKTVARRVNDVGRSELRASRLTLALYSEAMEQITGPTYDLYSTVKSKNSATTSKTVSTTSSPVRTTPSDT
jgi:MFS family permease